MKILITYSSKTGNTKKVAEAIKSQLPQADIFPVSEMQSMEKIGNYDLIFIGGWIDRGTFNAEAIKTIEFIKNKKTAYFFTLGAYPDSKHAEDCVNNIDALLEKNLNEIVGRYFCQGAIDPKLIEYLSKLPQGHIMSPNEERKKRWEDAASHPDINDLENAKKFAEDIIKNYLNN